MRSTPKWLVAGGGISGLAAAQCLQARGCDYRLFEKSPGVGGLTRTIRVGDFCFDYTGHFLHLKRYKSPAAIPYANLTDDEWRQVDRRSYFFVAGRLIATPIQYHLGQLPPALLQECVSAYESRPRDTAADATFRDYIVRGFGQAVADRFLIPQNEKTMAISLDRLSPRAVKRFFPPPDDALIRAGFSPEPAAIAEYNSTFWYPKSGGIDRLVCGLGAGLTRASVNEEIVAVDLEQQSALTSAGRRVPWDILLSSIPLKTFCGLTNDGGLRQAAAQLSHSTTISFNLGLRGPLPDELQGAHWIYVPDRSIPFYRFGCYSNISDGVCSRGSSAVYVEAAVAAGSIGRTDIVAALQPQVLTALEELRWIRREDVACLVTHVIDCAYVHHTPERERVMDEIRSRLAAHGVHLIGRYGLWDYISMEDSIESAVAAVQERLG